MTIPELFKKIGEATPSEKEGLERTLSEELGKLTELDTGGLNSANLNYLLEKLASNTKITKLIIRQTLTESTTKNLQALLAQNKKLTHLHIDGQALSYIPIDLVNMTHLTEGLAHNTTLDTLEISGYRIFDDSMKKLSDFLTRNATLTSLNLKECDKFTPEDADILFTAIAANNTLQNVHLVNRETQWETFKSGTLAKNKLYTNKNKKEAQQTYPAHPIPQTPPEPSKENDTLWIALLTLTIGFLVAAIVLVATTPITAVAVLGAFVVGSLAIGLWPSVKERFGDSKTSSSLPPNTHASEPTKTVISTLKNAPEVRAKKEEQDKDAPSKSPKSKPTR